MTQAVNDVFPTDRAFVSPEVYDAFFAVVVRLEATLAGENAALRSNRHGDLVLFTRQKRQGFLELDRIARALAATIPSQDILARLAGFRTALEVNERLLAVHLAAVKEVTNTIVRCMREADSDGTYSRAHGSVDFGRAEYELS